MSTDVEQFWEQHYGAAERVWSGRANATLVDVVQDLPPGTALQPGESRGTDLAESLSELLLRVRLEVEGPKSARGE